MKFDSGKEEWPDDYLPILTRRVLYQAYEGRDLWCKALEAELASCAKRIRNQRAEINLLLAKSAEVLGTNKDGNP